MAHIIENGTTWPQEIVTDDTTSIPVNILHQRRAAAENTEIVIVRDTNRQATTAEAGVGAQGGTGHRTTGDHRVER